MTSGARPPYPGFAITQLRVGEVKAHDERCSGSLDPANAATHSSLTSSVSATALINSPCSLNGEYRPPNGATLAIASRPSLQGPSGFSFELIRTASGSMDLRAPPAPRAMRCSASCAIAYSL